MKITRSKNLFLGAVAGLNLMNTDGIGDSEAFKNAQKVAGDSGFSKTPYDINALVGNIIQVILGFLGIIFVILIIVSGYQWMTAGGNSDTIKKAKDRMINAVIGLIIVLAAYSITWFVVDVVLKNTGVTN